MKDDTGLHTERGRAGAENLYLHLIESTERGTKDENNMRVLVYLFVAVVLGLALVVL